MPAYVRALAHWLEAGQAAHEAETALKNVKAKVRRASSERQRERAKRRQDQLLSPEAHRRRNELAAKARDTWTKHEAAAAAAGWMVNAHYPKV